MRLLIDRPAIDRARLIARQQYDDRRTYYLLGGAIVVLRNGLDLHTIAGQVCDCAVGWDIAQEGFAPEDQVGRKRTKVTVYRTLIGVRRARTLMQLLAEKP